MMNIIRNIILLCITLLPLSLCAQIRLATYNIRFDAPQDTPLNAWSKRKVMIADLIRFHDFHAFGLQEARPAQLEEIKEALPEYTNTNTAAGKVNNGANTQIFYKIDKFKLLNSGNFWLSPDPASSKKAWDAKFARNCVWVELQELSSGVRFYYFNTHLDHVGWEARKNSVILLLAKIKEIAKGDPTVMSGDFNFGQQDENYKMIARSGLLADAFELARIRYALNGTTNSFSIDKKSDRRIDHIFVSKDFSVKRYGVLTDNSGGRFPSDHFPVLVELEKK